MISFDCAYSEYIKFSHLIVISFCHHHICIYPLAHRPQTNQQMFLHTKNTRDIKWKIPINKSIPSQNQCFCSQQFDVAQNAFAKRKKKPANSQCKNHATLQHMFVRMRQRPPKHIYAQSRIGDVLRHKVPGAKRKAHKPNT